jgi:alkylation response protein AidB-like acyl-CoA dehydrogenase
MQDELLRTELLAVVDSIAPILAEHAPLSEKLGRMDAASIEAVRSTRLLGLFAPRELGGLEADPVTVALVLEALARIDGSASWTIGILSSASIFGAYLPAATARRIFSAGVPPMAGSFLPKGQAEPVSGGYRVKGRWPFASGIHHADWVNATAVVPGRPQPEGLRTVVLPREQVFIHDNWQVAGLRGTGSCDFSVEDVLVPEEMTFSLMDLFRGNAVTGGAAVRLGIPAAFASFHIGIPLGIARRALDEITTQAIEKGRGFPPSPLHTHPHFQLALGKAEMELASVRALAMQLLSELYAEAQGGRTPPPTRQAEARAASTYVTEVAQRVTSVAFQAAGGGALFDTNPLQHCFRDVLAAGQHFVVSQTSYQALGQFKLNQPDANPML